MSEEMEIYILKEEIDDLRARAERAESALRKIIRLGRRLGQGRRMAEIARLTVENALLKAEPVQPLVLRCGELEAEIADMREHFSVAAENLLALERENKKVCKALSDLYDACMQADGEGELYYTISGDLLDAARIALGEAEEKCNG
jgi:hypothetical protein